MIEPPQIVETTSILNAAIHLVVPIEKIREVIDPGLEEIFTLLADQRLVPNGEWFTHHLQRPTDVFDFEICVPVQTPVVATGRVKPGEWPAMKVARTVYQGPYEGLHAAWAEFLGWIAAQGLAQGDELWERYLVGPESSINPNDWRTELSRPLVG